MNTTLIKIKDSGLIKGKINSKKVVHMSNRVTDIPNLVHCWKFNNLYLAGQPGEGAFKELSERGVKKIINIRSNGEADFSKDKEKYISSFNL